PIYHRKYVKVQTIMSYSGGLIKCILIAGWILSFYFSKVKLNLKILNTIFEFDIKSESFVNGQTSKDNSVNLALFNQNDTRPRMDISRGDTRILGDVIEVKKPQRLRTIIENVATSKT